VAIKGRLDTLFSDKVFKQNVYEFYFGLTTHIKDPIRVFAIEYLNLFDEVNETIYWKALDDINYLVNNAAFKGLIYSDDNRMKNLLKILNNKSDYVEIYQKYIYRILGLPAFEYLSDYVIKT